MTLTVTPLIGPEIQRVLSDVARLRIEVFREWPYLYDGDFAYEAEYLADFASSDGAIVVAALDGDTLVGAATGAPFLDHADAFADAFADTDVSLEDVFYCAESVLLPAYRGRGLGHAFFDHREAQARASNFGFCAFCAVIRSDDHPKRPVAPRSLEAFWKGRGYAPLPNAVARFAWKDIGESAATEKALQFWIRPLEGAKS
ncbi:GNAT family N-acetyltransferase [Maritimibacter dapengensis]|uniref:GNAT family N-acetyltransferase n=1 Tax=Maritimibacter dapengensis TaxID=2836868 RepID=A0ABS6T129_9RHOB|nr:GNAT family N-acetyltransferase [Maritimibacter dapengensis]MBV7378938.1 GNAT family N-acetyltransferase [Maritimibacter dapengensis]